MEPHELVDAALRLGLGAVGVTEHGSIAGADAVKDLGERRGLLVFRGVEVYTGDGDMLVYGVYQDIEPFDSALDLISWAHERGGVVVAAHPFRGRFGLLGARRGITPEEVLAGVDAVEVHNGADPDPCRAEGAQAASRHGRPSFGGSDAHFADDVGRCVTVLEEPVRDESGWVEAIRSGRIRGSDLQEALGGSGSWWR